MTLARDCDSLPTSGSICMDLLVADGWLPSYSIAAVLLQIRMAISSTEPRPARLAQNWQTPYGVQEALDGLFYLLVLYGLLIFCHRICARCEHSWLDNSYRNSSIGSAMMGVFGMLFLVLLSSSVGL
jgi:hypothetical protein